MSATDLTGATFTVIGQYQAAGSNNPTIYYNSGNQTAPTTVNPSPSVQAGFNLDQSYNFNGGTTSLTVTGNQITEQFAGLYSYYNSGSFSFNGYVINIGNGAPAISGVTLANSNAIIGAQPTFSYTANTVSINQIDPNQQLSGIWLSNSSLTLNLTFATPAAPATPATPATPDYTLNKASGNYDYNTLDLYNPLTLNSNLVTQYQVEAVYYSNNLNPTRVTLPDNLPEIYLSGVGKNSLITGNSSPITGNIIHNVAHVTSGSWNISGVDAVVLPGNFADYTITPDGNGYQYINKMNGAVIEVTNAETISFVDQTLHLNYSQTARDLVGLYEVAFGRLPDAAGVASWTSAISKGLSEASVAAAFLASSEFATAHGSNLTDAQFATLLYQSVNHTAPSAGTLAQLTSTLHTESRAQLLLDFATGSVEQQYVTSLVGIQGGVLTTAAA